MNEYFTRKVRRVAFFARSALLERAPRSRLSRRLESIEAAPQNQRIDDSVLERVNYYNRLDEPFSCGKQARSREELSRGEGSYYYFDLQAYWRIFPPNLKLNYLFGDTVHIPDSPTIVKSRPISNNNQNSVLFKLDKLRHFDLFRQQDQLKFRDKRPSAVWRGVLNNPLRRTLVQRFGQSSRHDIGYVDQARLECEIPPREKLSVREQLRNRYILSVEGYDVATNLKWIFASQSLCLMPRPRYETWFMEGQLEPGFHYVEVRPDFADLEDKVAYYNLHPDEAEAIIANANQHYRQFTDDANEDLISILVLRKFFELSGQLPALSGHRELFHHQDLTS